ncbi:MAG: F0F1 ATP synthase subunit alpha, partial [Acidaminococcaceae bacterium]|nr:F0F1 ATP synthase subunit alpha [Acidaminococcaceae bacterium]
KQVAGTLRLDLAQFRELAAFAQFASDLEKATKAQLDRGQRLTELLKQGQYAPLPVEKQVMAIYLGTRGYLDDVAVKDVTRCEKEFLEFMDTNHPEVGADIVATKKLSDNNEAVLKQAIAEFKGSFVGAR